MTCGIYKIENKINGKKYIGQSNNIERRWKYHLQYIKNGKSKMYQAFREDGIENFDFSIVEECPIIDLDEKEKYWISYYNSIENGYNMIFGSPFKRRKYHKLSDDEYNNIVKDLIDNVLSIDEIINKYNLCSSYIYDINWNNTNLGNPNLTYPLRNLKTGCVEKYEDILKKEIDNIVFDLQENKLTYVEISEKYHLTHKMLYNINKGKKYYNEKLKYPLRDIKTKISKQEAEEIQKLLKETNLSYKEIGEKFNQKAGRISDINNGDIFINDKYNYPIRKMVHFLNKDELFEVISLLKNTNLSFTDIGKKFEISPTAVKYINDGVSYHDENIQYPFRKK